MCIRDSHSHVGWREFSLLARAVKRFSRSSLDAANKFLRHAQNDTSFRSPDFIAEISILSVDTTTGDAMISTIQERLSSRTMLVLLAFIFVAGCSSKKDANKGNFKDAINSYYSAHPECLWSTTVKFPTRSDTSDSNKTTESVSYTHLSIAENSKRPDLPSCAAKRR